MKSKYNIIYIRLYYSDIMSEKNRRSRKKILQKNGGWQPNSKKSSNNNNTRKTRNFYSQNQGRNKKVTKFSNKELPRFLNKPENNK